MRVLLNNKVDKLEEKQKIIFDLIFNTSQKNIRLKVHEELSPLSWHLMHCVYIESIWIRSKIYNNTFLENKLKKIADSSLVPVEKRNKSLPDKKELLSFSKKIFKENISFLNNAIVSNSKRVSLNDLRYILDFLNQHHAQHIENIKNILNILNLKFNNSKDFLAASLDPKIYKFNGVKVNDGYYNIGANKDEFGFDNESPKHKVRLKKYKISKSVLTISEWLGFMIDGGYEKQKYWTLEGWNWKNKYNISFPFNWVYKDKKKFLISTYKGFKSPKRSMPVSNISRYELEAFANYSECRLPHEYEWEVAYKKINKKYKVWEWNSNKFFGYKGFKAYPYKEYSVPWFKNFYFTLKGASIYSMIDIKRPSFRNFYKPTTRYIVSGGRLCI